MDDRKVKQTLELVCVKKEPDMPAVFGPPPPPPVAAQGPAGPAPRCERRGKKGPGAALKRLSALVLVAAIASGVPAGSVSSLLGSYELSSFLLAAGTEFPSGNGWDAAARLFAGRFGGTGEDFDDFGGFSLFVPPISDGGLLFYDGYQKNDYFPDVAANPFPPESGLTRYKLYDDTGDGPIATTVVPRGTAGYDYFDGIYVLNGTGEATDVQALLHRPLPFSPPAGGAPLVLILHTHTHESYTAAPGEFFDADASDRTSDREFSVVAAGAAMAEALRAAGIGVIHDKTVYDETYNGAYARSKDAVERLLKENPTIKVVLDVHRDALNDRGERKYKLVCETEAWEEPAAQVMLVVGTDKGVNAHPGWEANYSLALKIQQNMVRENETLPRPIKLTRSSYYQHVAPGALIVEVGANGNTVSEAKAAAAMFAGCLADVLLK